MSVASRRRGVRVADGYAAGRGLGLGRFEGQRALPGAPLGEGRAEGFGEYLERRPLALRVVDVCCDHVDFKILDGRQGFRSCPLRAPG